MKPLFVAFGLTLLNVMLYLFLRLDDVYALIFPGKKMEFINISEGHLLLFWFSGLVMIVCAAVVAGRLSWSRLFLRNSTHKR